VTERVPPTEAQPGDVRRPRVPSPASASWWVRLSYALTAAPEYPASADDLATISIAGLRVPRRATLAVVLFVAFVVLDYNRTFFPPFLPHDQSPDGMRAQAFDRLIFFGLLPLITIILVFRDQPQRYGLRLGDWRIGVPLAVAGSLLMVPVVLLAARVPDFQAYYAQSATSVPNLVVTHVLDLAPAEFLFRGFLMFALMRVVGPVAVVVVTLPFAFTHLSKPEAETLSTLVGGLAFGWLNWRTGSILYSAAAHVFILTLLIANAAR
jgi:membrane protease YdiL (CAAX protease family)